MNDAHGEASTISSPSSSEADRAPAKSAADPAPSQGFAIQAANGAVLVLGCVTLIYPTVLALLAIPIVQRHVIYLHRIHFPLFAQYDKPEKYGLPVHRTVNVKITTPDNERLGAWLVLPKVVVSSEDTLLPPHPPSDEDIRKSVSTRPTILLFHGNGATRAMAHRVQYASKYARAFGANVLAIDYRGFADSTGIPSKEGLVIDARAALDWVLERGAKIEEVLFVGLSLGTGVVSALAAELAREGIHPKGIVLLAPFTSIKSVLLDYHAFGVLPVLQPLQIFPFLTTLVSGFFTQHFDTYAIIQEVQAPILMVHARDDHDIPYTHSRKLFAHVNEPIVTSSERPQTPHKVNSEEQDDSSSERHSSTVLTQVIDGFGDISRFRRPSGQEVALAEVVRGGHNNVGLQDGVVDVIGNMFGFND